MRILILADVAASCLTGGSSRVLRAQTDGLANRGHQVFVIAKGPPTHTFSESIVLPSGVVESQVPWSGGRGLFSLFKLKKNALKIIKRYVAEWQPEMMMIHQPILAGGVLDYHLLHSIPAVYICHSFAFEEYFTREQRGRFLRSLGTAWLKHEEYKLLNHSSRIIVLSDYTRQRLADTFSITDKVDIIPGAADTDYHPVTESERNVLRDSYGMHGTAFLTVRNLVPRTGVDLLIDAFNILHRKNQDTHLWVAGQGPLESEIRNKIHNYRLDDAVHMLGFVPDEVLQNLYRAADCFVLPTLFLEGFGLVTIEALASGTPVVATPVGANIQVVGGWRKDAVVDSIDSLSLSSGMEHMLYLIQHDPTTLRESCAKYGSHFTWNRHLDKLESLLLMLKDQN